MPANFPQSKEDLEQIVFDLQVHQIELEMQNEELHRMQVELETARARYFDLYNLAPGGRCDTKWKWLGT